MHSFFPETKKKGPVVKVLAEVDKADKTVAEQSLLDLLEQFSQENLPKKKAFELVSAMSSKIVSEIDSSEPVLLVPIMRAGIAMWPVFNSFFQNAESTFPVCHKNKGSNEAIVIWPAAPDLKNKRILLLDVICATGDTINAIVTEMCKRMPNVDLQIEVLCCYISPQARDALLKNTHITAIHACILSHSVDSHGYLIPATNGDAGDKLFGNKGALHLDSFECRFDDEENKRTSEAEFARAQL